jgi:hypothetical protein
MINLPRYIAYMKKILILGAGKSSIYLIDYLVDHASAENWEITVGDITSELALAKTNRQERHHRIKRYSHIHAACYAPHDHR